MNNQGINNQEKKIKAIVDILLKHERIISESYEYPLSIPIEEHLAGIAKDILLEISKEAKFRKGREAM